VSHTYILLFSSLSLAFDRILLLFRSSESKWFRLYGILHAILLLLAGRVASAQHPRNPLVGNEMLFLIFSRCPRYTELYDLLIDSLEVFAAQDLPVAFNSNGTVKPRDNDPRGKGTSSAGVVDSGEGSSSGPSVKQGNEEAGDGEGGGDNNERLWMGPAVLILDAMCQSLLVDKSVLKVCLCVLSFSS
jgi:hypothetical protein